MVQCGGLATLSDNPRSPFKQVRHSEWSMTNFQETSTLRYAPELERNPPGTNEPTISRQIAITNPLNFVNDRTAPSGCRSANWAETASCCSRRHHIKEDTRNWGTWAREFW